MLTVAEAAGILGLSEVRVRQLAGAGTLLGTRHGNAWALDEASVWNRALNAGKPGRPRSAKDSMPATSNQEHDPSKDAERLHDLYLECKELLGQLPSLDLLKAAYSPEEAAFCMAAFDFFMQQKQAELVKLGVY